MKIKFLKPAAYLLLLFGVMYAVTSCEKDEPEVMKLPPAESLVIDWSMFPSNDKKSLDEAGFVYGNYLFSLGTVVVWNTVVAANMAIPAIAYTAALDHTPVYLGDDTWEWSYSVSYNQRTIAARLTGARIDNETYSVEMVLSESGGFSEFKWFDGVVRYDRTAANWTLRHSPDNPVDYLDIAYEKDFETEEANIRYTVIDPQNELYNGYVEFGIDPAYDLDAHYTVSRGDSATNIEWSTSNNMGRVKAQHHFGDMNWHCWDTQLQDVECPVEE
jgi:hypothetical protein